MILLATFVEAKEKLTALMNTIMIATPLAIFVVHLEK
jgi:hypothetical protein